MKSLCALRQGPPYSLSLAVWRRPTDLPLAPRQNVRLGWGPTGGTDVKLADAPQL
jgi:hypothetical protein